MSARAIILAAGSGSRLMPYTDGRPKGMVALAGLPLLERQIATLRQAGITDITLVGGYQAWQLERFDCPIVLNPDYARTNMVASLHKAEAAFDGSSDLVICYSDIVYDPAVLNALLAGSGEITVAADKNWQSLWQARMEDPLSDAESFRLSSDGCIAELGRKVANIGEIEGQYIGLIRVATAAQSRFFELYNSLDKSLSYEGQPFKNLYLTGYLQMLIESGWSLKPAWIKNGWLEIDTVGDLQIYHRMLLAGQLGDLIDLQQAGGILLPARDLFSGLESFITARLKSSADTQTDGTQFDLASFVTELEHALVPDRKQCTTLDHLARKIEISGRLYARYDKDSFRPLEERELANQDSVEALLAFMLKHAAWFGDLRLLNTVVKALHTDFRQTHEIAADSPLEGWSRTAIVALTG